MSFSEVNNVNALKFGLKPNCSY